MQARKLYLDTQARAFVASPNSTLPALDPVFFNEDVESIELYFLEPTGDFSAPYTNLDYSANTVKVAVGVTAPAALQVTWSALATSTTATITSLVTGGSGTSAVQRITLSPQPVSGGWAVQFPSRAVTVSSVSANIFTAADHGLYSGQSATLTAFSFTASAVANGGSYFVIRNSKDTFSLANTASSTTALAAEVTSGGGTATVSATTTCQLTHNAAPSDVQAAIASAGLAIAGVPQIVVTGTRGKQYVITYAGGSTGAAYANVSVVGSTLAAAPGLSANLSLNTAEMAALVAAGQTAATLEVEVTDGTKRQTYQRSATLGDDIILSTSPSPTAPTVGLTFYLYSQDASVWEISIGNDGVLSATKQP
jgi:hypothetical protein